ncbi:MAG: ThuA domain-containing protein [Candidatus Poribacteria bacterium]|nr:ThuA domain-containing protein [Candidatus Poribacteria bacterium]
MNIAVVTGEHGFREKDFDAVFQSMEGIAFVREDLDVFVDDPDQKEYDTVVFYNFHRPYPTEEQAKTILGLTERGQGLVILHHAILAFPEWDKYSDMCGIHERTDFGYFPKQTLQVQVTDPTHPITEGIADWEMGDETYTMKSAGEDSTILLTVDHPNSMDVLGWAREYGNSRIFCLQSGHDNVTYSNPNFREVLLRWIQWCAKQ